MRCPTPRSLEEAAVAGDAVNLDFLFVEENVVADFQTCHSRVDVGAHEVCKIEAVADGAHKQRATLLKPCDRLAGEIVVGHESAAICIAGEGVVVESAENLVHVYRHSGEARCILGRFPPTR